MTCIFSSPLLTRDYSNDGNCLNVGRTQLAGMNSENGTISQRKMALGMKLTHGSPLYGHEGKTWLITRWVQKVFLGFPWFSGWTFGQTQYMPHLRPAKKHPTRSKDAIRFSGRLLGKVLRGGSPSFHPRFTHLFRRLSQHDSWRCSCRCRLASPSNSCWLYHIPISATKSPGFLVTSCNILVLELLEST